MSQLYGNDTNVKDVKDDILPSSSIVQENKALDEY